MCSGTNAARLVVVLAILGMAGCRESSAVNAIDAARLKQAIERGVSFLADAQEADGEFPVYFYITSHLAVRGKHQSEAGYTTYRFLDPTPFGTAGILYNLWFLQPFDPQMAPMAHRAADFLLGQMEPGGIWRYWSRKNPNFQVKILPPDLDDTSLVSLVLLLTGHPPLEHLELLKTYRLPSGLYRTWMEPAIDRIMRQGEADCVVNANMLAYLARRGEQPAELCGYLTTLLRTEPDALCSTFYPSPYALSYAVGRAYRMGASCLAPAIPDAVSFLERTANTDGTWQRWPEPLQTALAVNALLDLRPDHPLIAPGIRRLLETQMPTGAWPTGPYYATTPVYAFTTFGSETISTGMALEALAKYADSQR